jgi:hypothetical protein
MIGTGPVTQSVRSVRTNRPDLSGEKSAPLRRLPGLTLLFGDFTGKHRTALRNCLGARGMGRIPRSVRNVRARRRGVRAGQGRVQMGEAQMVGGMQMRGWGGGGGTLEACHSAGPSPDAAQVDCNDEGQACVLSVPARKVGHESRGLVKRERRGAGHRR